jgi:hypothetical protein
MSDTGVVLGQVLAELLACSHLLPPDELVETLVREARPLGVSAARLYLADLQLCDLKAMPGGASASPDVLPIDSTTAGLAFRTATIQHDPVAGDGPHHLWIPVIDGTERLGVLELAVHDAGPEMLDSYRALASLAGLMMVSKSKYSDTFAHTQRSREMALQGEMVWAFLAPRTFATERVLVAATLEPAYEIGGDAFDYALIGDHLHVSIFDAVGHDLAAGLLASVGIASCRSTRRAGGTLRDVLAKGDHAIAHQFGDSRFVTALLCELDVVTGEFSWIPCGHPPPLLIRDGRVIGELARAPQLPLGLSGLDRMIRSRAREPEAAGEIPVYTEQLEPGDRLLLYTDGIIEGRAADDQPFGVERLTEFFVRHEDTRIPAPETLRRLNRAIVDYQQGRLSDDATIVMLEWRPDRPGDQLIP